MKLVCALLKISLVLNVVEGASLSRGAEKETDQNEVAKRSLPQFPVLWTKYIDNILYGQNLPDLYCCNMPPTLQSCNCCATLCVMQQPIIIPPPNCCHLPEAYQTCECCPTACQFPIIIPPPLPLPLENCCNLPKPFISCSCCPSACYWPIIPKNISCCHWPEFLQSCECCLYKCKKPIPNDCCDLPEEFQSCNCCPDACKPPTPKPESCCNLPEKEQKCSCCPSACKYTTTVATTLQTATATDCCDLPENKRTCDCCPSACCTATYSPRIIQTTKHDCCNLPKNQQNCLCCPSACQTSTSQDTTKIFTTLKTDKTTTKKDKISTTTKADKRTTKKPKTTTKAEKTTTKRDKSTTKNGKMSTKRNKTTTKDYKTTSKKVRTTKKSKITTELIETTTKADKATTKKSKTTTSADTTTTNKDKSTTKNNKSTTKNDKVTTEKDKTTTIEDQTTTEKAQTTTESGKVTIKKVTTKKETPTTNYTKATTKEQKITTEPDTTTSEEIRTTIDDTTSTISSSSKILSAKTTKATTPATIITTISVIAPYTKPSTNVTSITTNSDCCNMPDNERHCSCCPDKCRTTTSQQSSHTTDKEETTTDRTTATTLVPVPLPDCCNIPKIYQSCSCCPSACNVPPKPFPQINCCNWPKYLQKCDCCTAICDPSEYPHYETSCCDLPPALQRCECCVTSSQCIKYRQNNVVQPTDNCCYLPPSEQECYCCPTAPSCSLNNDNGKELKQLLLKMLMGFPTENESIYKSLGYPKTSFLPQQPLAMSRLLRSNHFQQNGNYNGLQKYAARNIAPKDVSQILQKRIAESQIKLLNDGKDEIIEKHATPGKTDSELHDEIESFTSDRAGCKKASNNKGGLERNLLIDLLPQSASDGLIRDYINNTGANINWQDIFNGKVNLVDVPYEEGDIPDDRYPWILLSDHGVPLDPSYIDLATNPKTVFIFNDLFRKNRPRYFLKNVHEGEARRQDSYVNPSTYVNILDKLAKVATGVVANHGEMEFSKFKNIEDMLFEPHITKGKKHQIRTKPLFNEGNRNSFKTLNKDLTDQDVAGEEIRGIIYPSINIGESLSTPKPSYVFGTLRNDKFSDILLREHSKSKSNSPDSIDVGDRFFPMILVGKRQPGAPTVIKILGWYMAHRRKNKFSDITLRTNINNEGTRDDNSSAGLYMSNHEKRMTKHNDTINVKGISLRVNVSTKMPKMKRVRRDVDTPVDKTDDNQEQLRRLQQLVTELVNPYYQRKNPLIRFYNYNDESSDFNGSYNNKNFVNTKLENSMDTSDNFENNLSPKPTRWPVVYGTKEHNDLIIPHASTTPSSQGQVDSVDNESQPTENTNSDNKDYGNLPSPIIVVLPEMGKYGFPFDPYLRPPLIFPSQYCLFNYFNNLCQQNSFRNTLPFLPYQPQFPLPFRSDINTVNQVNANLETIVSNPNLRLVREPIEDNSNSEDYDNQDFKTVEESVENAISDYSDANVYTTTVMPPTVDKR